MRDDSHNVGVLPLGVLESGPSTKITQPHNHSLFVTYTSQDPLCEWAFGSYASPNPMIEACTGPYAMKERRQQK